MPRHLIPLASLLLHVSLFIRRSKNKRYKVKSFKKWDEIIYIYIYKIVCLLFINFENTKIPDKIIFFYIAIIFFYSPGYLDFWKCYNTAFFSHLKDWNGTLINPMIYTFSSAVTMSLAGRNSWQMRHLSP